MKKAILMMTFGSPEEITFEGVADFFTNIRRGVRPQDHEIQTLYSFPNLASTKSTSSRVIF